MAPKKRENVDSSAIVTRSSSKLVLDPQPPKSKKAKTNTIAPVSSMNVANMESIATRSSTGRGKAKLPSPQPVPKSSVSSSKKKEPSAIVTQSSTRPVSKEILGSQPVRNAKTNTAGGSASFSKKRAVMTRSSTQLSKSKKVTNPSSSKKSPNVTPTASEGNTTKKGEDVGSSTIVTRGKPKLESNAQSSKAKKEDRSLFSPAPKRRPTASTVLTRSTTGQAKGKTKYDAISDPQSPKSKKGKSTSSSVASNAEPSKILTRSGKAKLKPTTSGGNSESPKNRANVNVKPSTIVTRHSKKN